MESPFTPLRTSACKARSRKRKPLLDQTTSSSSNVYAGLSSTNAAPQPWKFWPCWKNACKKRSVRSIPGNARTTGTPRPFAGINILLAGDCWQFPAVKATSIFHNPFKHGQSVQVANLQKVLWTHDRANIQHLFELTQEHRCVDPWLSAILHAARHGVVTQEQWAFLHGFPTLHAGSWDPRTNKCSCKKPACNALAQQWTQEVLDPKNTRTWQDHRQAECSGCAAERRRRCIVAGASDLGPNPKDPKFLQAPFVHGLNAAKYVAALLRARWVAAEQQHLLLWVVAQDTPLFHTDPDTEAQELQHRKEQWLQRHDQATAGIMGLLPLLPGMPVRITQTLPDLKPWGLFKNTRGQLFGWSLAEEDIAAIPACQQPELVLQKMPACLFVRIPGATWQHRPGLPPGVACIRPVVQHWKLEAHGTATVARRGFPLACDYAGTAHSFMGATLTACSLDLGFWDTAANRDSQLSAYMCLSRVKKAEDLCIARPFSPNLLSQGELIGPDIFLAVHRQTLTLADAKSKFEQEQVQRKRNPETLFFCRGCTPKAKGGHGLLPLRDFTSNNLWQPDAWFEIVCLGMERLCSQCRHPQPSGNPSSAESESSSKCAFCNKTQLPKLGFCKQCLSQARLACARCDVGRKLKPKTLADFSPAEIQRRRKTGDLRRARCMKCELQQPNKCKAKAGQCRTCRNLVSVSHLRQYDSKANDGICRKCWRKATDLEAATAKVCPQCSTPLKPAATPGSWCQSCAYPPCASCQKVDRPHNRPVPRQTQTGVAVPSLCSDQDRQSLSTVRQTSAHEGETRHLVSELCLSTVCRLPASSSAKQRYVPCQASTLLAVRRMRPSKLSDVPNQSHRSRRRRRARHRLSAVCRTRSQVRRMQRTHARPPAFPRLVPRVCLSAMCSWLWSTAPEQKRRRPRQISCQTHAGVDVPDVPAITKWTGQTP